MTPALANTDATWAVGMFIAACLLMLWGLVAFIRASSRRLDAAIEAALAENAAVFGEPARAEVEAGWLEERTPIADGIDFDMWRQEMGA